ncbi:MAG TPA: TIGR04255 family protein [Thermoanaerobaculia bacterium]|nr:TIGR04255 family protein [Thermoanaerobaculia bacterium]
MSTEERVALARSPIVEAVVDIDCDLPPDIVFADLESRAKARFADQYPGFGRRLRQPSSELLAGSSRPKLNVREATDAFQFLGEHQLVQVRRGGFSFNRLAPYLSLDEYLPEIKRTWQIFVELAEPVTIRRIGLRYINRIFLPAGEGIVDLSDYLYLGSKLPEEVSLKFTAVLNEYSAIEDATGHEVKVRMVINEQEKEIWRREEQPLPVIFDIAGSHRGSADPQVWENIEATIRALGYTAYAIFWSSLTERCLNLFR